MDARVVGDAKRSGRRRRTGSSGRRVGDEEGSRRRWIRVKADETKMEEEE
jgi:hypothetical protein